MAQRFTKQSGETLDYPVDFTDFFADRVDTLASYTLTADSGVTASAVMSGKIVTVYVAGGTDGSEYKITVRGTTTSSPAVVREVDFFIRVKDQ